MGLLSEEDVAANLAKLQRYHEDGASAVAEAQTSATRSFHYVRPLSDAAQAALDAIENTDERFMLGIDAIDFRTRGFGAKELIFVTGFSHSGKTQLLNTAIINNPNKRILFFSMDDPAEMILIKLVCMLENVDAEMLEKRIKQGDMRSRLLLTKAATEVFPYLTIVDDSLGLSGIKQSLVEYEQLHGSGPDVVIIDYLGSMQGGDDDGDGIKQKAAELKRWVKENAFPTIVVQQNTRSRGAPGEPITMLSMGYGGEQEATMVIGVRRKRDWEALEPSMRDMHKNTVTLHLVKNKRPPGKLTHADGVDLYMEPLTGLIRPLGDEDWPTRTTDLRTAQEVSQAVRS